VLSINTTRYCPRDSPAPRGDASGGPLRVKGGRSGVSECRQIFTWKRTCCPRARKSDKGQERSSAILAFRFASRVTASIRISRLPTTRRAPRRLPLGPGLRLSAWHRPGTDSCRGPVPQRHNRQNCKSDGVLSCRSRGNEDEARGVALMAVLRATLVLSLFGLQTALGRTTVSHR
jgi:hypothetical protein